jgi:hypothetical protein
MISWSIGHRAKFSYTLRWAGRSAPMMGINRSNLSRLTIPFLMVLLGMPLAARPSSLQDSAKELARKIAAALPVKEEAALEVRKLSSMGPDDFAAIVQNLKSELQTLGVPIAGTSAVTTTIHVTLSENVRSYVWAADIRWGDSAQVVFQVFTKPSESHTVSGGMPITLHSEKFWEGSQRILDAEVVVDSSGADRLLLLTPDALLIRRAGSDVHSTVPIPVAGMASRDPTGFLTATEDGVTVTSTSQICNINTNAGTLIECQSRPNDGPKAVRIFEKDDLTSPGQVRINMGSQIAEVSNICGHGQLDLAAGPGDYTEPDTIRLFDPSVVNGSIVEKSLSDVLPFPGPVIQISPGGTMPRAIVHNLQTGNYEAYHISISCGQ